MHVVIILNLFNWSVKKFWSQHVKIATAILKFSTYICLYFIEICHTLTSKNSLHFEKLQNTNNNFSNNFIKMGSSRKYLYPYHGWHFGIPNVWGVVWPGIPNAWRVAGIGIPNEWGVSSPGIPKGRGLKTLIYWLLKFGKPVLYARVLNKLSRKGMTMKLGCAACLELP